MTDQLQPAYQARTVRPPRRRVVLHVGSEQLAALLRLPDDVTVVGLAPDPVRDSVAFLIESERFEPVAEACEPPALVAEITVDYGDDGAVTQRVTWQCLPGAGVTVRYEPLPDEAEPEVDPT